MTDRADSVSVNCGGSCAKRERNFETSSPNSAMSSAEQAAGSGAAAAPADSNPGASGSNVQDAAVSCSQYTSVVRKRLS